MEHTDEIQYNIDQMIPTDSPLHQSIEKARTSASKSASKMYQLNDSIKNIVRDFIIYIFSKNFPHSIKMAFVENRILFSICTNLKKKYL